ncbi:Uncharacterised protein [Clostridioides difficile]|nr:Uncharacterised protein [Clostridioides difficile]
MNKTYDGYEFRDRVIEKVKTYFEEVLKAIRNSDSKKLDYLSKYIHEAKYTNLGFSVSGSGKGFGKDKFSFLVNSIKKSEAFHSGAIGDILDVELYVDDIGVDIISDLITNLIQDILSEYTENKLNNLKMNSNITHINTHFWNETLKQWDNKSMPVVYYSEPPYSKIYNYLLVPKMFTADENQKERIVKKIFDDCVFKLYKEKIFDNELKYSKYIHELKDGDKIIYKNKVVQFINNEFGEGSAKEGKGYLTKNGLLHIIKNYDVVKKFLDSVIKN